MSLNNTKKIIRDFFYRVICFALALLVCSLYAPGVYAAVDDYIDKFAANNIMFYDPDACKDGGSGSGSTVLTGDTNAEKVWNYFIGKGLNDMQVAGIMGNAIGESGAITTRASNDSYWGIFQFARIYNQKLWQTLDNAGLSEYYQNRAAYGETDENIPAATRDQLLQIQLDYVWDENEMNWTSEIQKAKSVEEATEIFLTLFERAVYNPNVRCTPITEYAPYLGELYQGTEERKEHAKNFYEEYSGKGTTTSGSNGVTITDGSNLTWIGDSLTAIYKSTLEEMLSAADIHALSSKHFSLDRTDQYGGDSGVTILNNLKNQNKVRDILVFELGTNDTDDQAITESSLKDVHETAKEAGAKVIVFMAAFTSDFDYSKHNDIIRNYAKENSDVHVADWEELIKDKVSEYLGDDGIHEKDADSAKKFFQLFIDTINENTTPMTAEQCCDPKDGSDGDQAIWDGEKYEMTDGQVSGVVAMIEKENGETKNQVRTQASQMANLFESVHPDKKGRIEDLVDYVKNGRWYDSDTGAAYDENYNADASYIKIVKEVLGEGKRNLPPEVVQHVTGTSQYIKAENNGEAFDVSDRDKFERGVTKITELFGDGAEWIFWDWADAEEKSGDPFGYVASNVPNGNGTSGSKSSACCDKGSGNVTKATIDGIEYAFPLAGATQANYLNPSVFGIEESVLSRIPCGDYSPGTCHHGYHAVDMGIMMEMVTGKDPTAADYGGESGFTNMYYNSAGATVVAVTAGTVEYADEYTNGVDPSWYDKCGEIGFMGDDGNYYWMGHMENTYSVKAGDHVEAGQELGKVGAPQCAQNTQSHLHIDTSNGALASGKDTSWAVRLMDELWESLPSSDSGSGVSSCNSGSLPAGGMTLEEAEEFMQLYKNLPSPQVDDPWNIIANDFPGPYPDDGCGASLANCVEYSLYFIHRYTTATDISGLPNGKDVVAALIEHGFKDGGQIPKAYAIFSKGSNVAAGHTGVVLGIDEANDKIIIGEAGCGTSTDWIGAHEYPLSEWTNSGVVYAYTDGLLK